MTEKWPTYNTLFLEYVEPGILVLALNRPKQLNALSSEMLYELKDVWQRLKYDEETRVVILLGNSEKGFCGGLDVNEPWKLTAPGLFEYQRELGELQLHMRTIPQPIICLVHGAAAGAGFSMSLASDIRIITPDARFSAYYINVGLGGADMGSSYFLPRLIGAGRAYEFLLTGRFMSAEEAMSLGYASRCVAKDQLMDNALELARQITAKDPIAIRLTKEAINMNLDCSGLEAGLAMENRNQVLMMMHNLSQGSGEIFGVKHKK